MSFIKKINAKILFLIILILYVLFPTNNSSLDAYAYAGYVKYSDTLFTPHHLLYNPLIYVIWKFLGAKLNVLWLSKIINSVFQILNLLIFYKLISHLNINKNKAILYTLIIAFSFVLWRYGTENETYIIPITFSLLGSFYFLQFLKSEQDKCIILSSLFASIACLFHQLHFFWWLGIFIGLLIKNKDIKTFLYYIFPAFIVPVVYVLVISFYENQELTLYNIQHYILHDFYQGSVMRNFGIKGVIMQLISTIRMFFQIHPNVYLVIKNQYVFGLSFIASAWLFFKLIRQIFTQKNIQRKQNSRRLFTNVHIGIGVANYAMAFYNYGNVEFMVMLPFLIFIIIALKYEIHKKILVNFLLLLFIWNFSFGILPNNIFNFKNEKVFVEYMKSNPNKTFVIKSHTTMNQFFYETGIYPPKNIFRYDKIDSKKLNDLIKTSQVYTDVIDKPEIFNKAKFTANRKRDNLFTNFSKEKVFEFSTLEGRSKVYKVSSK